MPVISLCLMTATYQLTFHLYISSSLHYCGNNAIPNYCPFMILIPHNMHTNITCHIWYHMFICVKFWHCCPWLLLALVLLHPSNPYVRCLLRACYYIYIVNIVLFHHCSIKQHRCLQPTSVGVWTMAESPPRPTSAGVWVMKDSHRRLGVSIT